MKRHRPLDQSPRRRRAQRARAFHFDVLEQRALLSIFTVNTTTDENDANAVPGDLSLREAIIKSNATPGPNTIIVPAGTYKLLIPGTGEDAGQTGDLDITNSVTIQGAGSASTIVDGNQLDRVFQVLGSGSNVPVVSLSGLTIQNGAAPPGSLSLGPNNGGGIEISGASVTINQCVIQNNRTGTLTGSDGGWGGGIDVTSGGTLAINNSTITGNTTGTGYYAGSGGGISVTSGGTLAISNSTITGNTTGAGTTVGGSGGGIEDNDSSITITGCTISNNATGDGGTSNVSAGLGGGIDFESRTNLTTHLTISNSVITNNMSGSSHSQGEGGGIFIGGSTLAMDGSTVSYNTASGDGGGLMNGNGTIDHITNCTIANNTAQNGFHGGGGIFNSVGTINLISGTTISGNKVPNDAGPYNGGGGGLFNWGQVGTIINSTITGNSINAGYGGGIMNNSNIGHIINTTIAGNSAPDGGGVFHATFSNVTPVIGELTNTIIAGNTAFLANSAKDFKEQGQVTSATHDLVQDPNGHNLTNGVNGNIVGLDPKLGALTNNGGPTATMALLSGSPAIDAGTTTGAPTIDQRGLPRPGPGNSGIDIGAFEVQSLINHPPVASNLNLATNEDVLLNGQVSATDADNDPLSYSVFAAPAHGTVWMQANGSFTYTPLASFSGSDSFTFRAYDGQAYSNIATVAITVNPVSLPQVANIAFTTVADGTVADRNLDGTFETVDTTSTSISDRWFTDPTIGQERGVFEFDLSRIAPGTPLQSVTIGLTVTSFTSSSSGGVTTYPHLIFRASAGDGAVTTADGAASATMAGTATVSSLGYQLFTLDPSVLQPFEGGFASIRLENSALNGQWVSVSSLEDTTRQPATLNVQISSVPSFSLSIAPNTVAETAGANAAMATLTRNGDLAAPLTVNLSSDNTSQLTVPATVTFAAGQSSVTFGVNAVNDGVRDNGHLVTVTAAASVVADPLALDPTFGVGGLAPTSLTFQDQFPHAALARQPDGKILAASQYSGDTWQLTRLNPDGTLDTSFGVNGVALAKFPITGSTGFYPEPHKIYVEADGSILVGGKIPEGTGTPALCRFTPSGQLDPTFGTGGIVDLSFYERPNTAWVEDIAVRPDGRILLAMANNGTSFLQAVQLLPNGSSDFTFGSGGGETPQIAGGATIAVALLPDGRFLLAGSNRVAMFTANGAALDATFGSGGSTIVDFGSTFPSISSMAIDSAGRIVVAGGAQFTSNGPSEFAAARLTPTGTLDTTFGSGGTALAPTGSNSGLVTSLVMQPNDQPVLAGLVTMGNTYQSALVRFTTTGALDTTFNGTGIFQQSLNPGKANLIYSAALQPNDNELVALTGWIGDMRVARFIMADRSATASAAAQVTVTDNLPPVAKDDGYSATVNTALTVAKPGVLANDTDPNNDALTAALVAGPTHGTLALNADGSFTYTPVIGFVGADSFTYKANDGLLDSNVATVSLTVSSTTSATFLKTDTTTQGTWKPAYGGDGFNVSQDPSANNPTIPAYATVTITGAQNYVWDPSSTDVRVPQKAAPNSTDRIAGVWYNSSSFSIDIHISDGNSHQIALYALDWDKLGRTETIQAIDDGSGAVLDTRTLANFQNGTYLVWTIQGNVTFKVTNTGPNNAVISGLFFGGAPAANPASATFLKLDATTQGTWKTVYGTDGFNVSQDPSANNPTIPSYAQVAITGAQNFVWNPSTSDVRAPQKAAPTASDRIAGTWYSAGSFSIDVHLSDNNSHQIALYAMDWDNLHRNETIQVTDDATGAVLDTRTLANFQNGVYLVWTVQGNVTFKVVNNGADNAVISGLFFGGTATTNPASATFLKLDTTTQGSWKTVYGADGFNVSQDPSANNPTIPSYANVSLTGAQNYVWDPSTSDVRTLQKAAPTATDRIAGTWYNSGSFAIDVQLGDGKPHQVALYALDWDSLGRTETIQVTDDATGAVLDTRTLANFQNGAYLVWTVTGNVTFKVVNTGPNNAVISGLFFG